MMEADLDITHRKYETPNDIFFYRPERFEWANQPPEGMVAIHEAVMDAGLRFPLHPTIFHLLAAWNLTPTQIAPNRWSYPLAILTVLGQAGLYRLPTPMVVN